jgi:hypothetical protein
MNYKINPTFKNKSEMKIIRSAISPSIVMTSLLISCQKQQVKSTEEIVVFFLLGGCSASEVYVPTFRNTLFHLHRLRKYRPMKTASVV